MIIRQSAAFALLVLTFGMLSRVNGQGPKTGDVTLTLTYNVTPDAGWEPGLAVTIAADARRDPTGQANNFVFRQFPGSYPRTAGQQLDFTLPNVRAGEKILVQGYICAEGTTDCVPSDGENPPTCAAEVHILGNLRPSCQPTFTWTGGQAHGGVLCRAECR